MRHDRIKSIRAFLLFLLVGSLLVATIYRQATTLPDSPRTKLTATRGIILENFTLAEIPDVVLAVLLVVLVSSVPTTIYKSVVPEKIYFSIHSFLDPPAHFSQS